MARARFLLAVVLAAGSGLVSRAEESWDAVFLGGAHVGYFHTEVNPVKDRGKDFVRVQVETVLTFKRNTDTTRIETLYGTIETPDGSILRLDSRTRVSDTELRIRGDVVNGKMTLVLEGSGEPQTKTIDWGDDVRGPYGAEMSLSRKPMKPGEEREVKVFIPDLNRIGVARLKAKPPEPVVLGGGLKKDLLRVEQATLVDGKPQPGMDQTHWIDETGQILKTRVDAFGGLETYRTTKEFATKAVRPGQFDLNLATIIKTRRSINNPYSSREIVYRVAMKDDDVAKIFPADRRQSVTADEGGKTGSLVVKQAGPEGGPEEPSPPGPEYSRANSLITSKDQRILNTALQITSKLDDPWAKASAVQHWVFQNIRKKNFGTTFAPANEVVRTLEGDCTEHSVLTAALCRAVGIPAKVVIGLLYVEPHNGFGFHMWNEVYVNNRWVALDAAWDQDRVDAVHLKLTESSLDGVSPFESFLAIVKIMDKLQIEPLEVR